MKKATAIIIGISCLFGVFALTCLAAVFGDADADGNLSANDAAVVLQKVLRNDYKMPVENTENDYMYITDVDRDGSLSAADSASILQKVLRNDYKMNCENMPDFTVDTKISDVINYPSFGEYGRLLFPANKNYYSGTTLKNFDLTWYTDIQPETTIKIVNKLKHDADSGEKIFYDIYTAEEKAADPRKEDTGLFFFKGNEGGKFAVCNAGGGFVYVGAMHDSFPHALELSKKGYNAFALIYRPGSQTACEDLARAIAFIHENADELGVDVNDYSLWGGSAGARMAAWLGSYGTEYFGEKEYPRPAAVIMQYTGLSEVTGTEPPTYNCVGTYDGIADYTTMQNRINHIKQNGTDAEIEIFDGLSHGFGLGEKTVAYGWLDNAVKFWERNMR